MTSTTCPSCGEALRPGARFCGTCGSFVEANPAGAGAPPPSAGPTFDVAPVPPPVPSPWSPAPPAPSWGDPAGLDATTVVPLPGTAYVPPVPPHTGSESIGSPPAPGGPPPRRSKLIPILVGVLVVLAVIGGVVVFLGARSSTQVASTSESTRARRTSSTADDEGGERERDEGRSGGDERRSGTTGRPAMTAQPAPSTTTTVLDPEAAATSALTNRITADRSVIEATLLDRWVPQVSSKRIGLTDPTTGITYDSNAKIMRDFEAHQARYGNVLLFESGYYSTYERPGFFVTVVNAPAATKADAEAWCTARGLTRNDCFATMMSHIQTSDVIS